MYRCLLFVLFSFGPLAVSADPGINGSFQRPHLFMENKGQVHGPGQESLPQILYHLDGRGINVSLTQNAIHYTFIRRINDGKQGITMPGIPAQEEFETVGMDVALLGADPTAKITAEEPQEYYEHYYTTEARRHGGIGKVRSFSRIVYHDVYPKVDWIVYLPGGEGAAGLKYDFVVRPGGDPASIRLKYSNASILALNGDGGLEAGTELGSIQEAKPYSYIRESGEEVASEYRLEGQVLSFAIEKTVKGTLVVDPQVIWASYYGGSGGDHATDVAAHNGHVYISGSTYSTSNIATVGSRKTNLSGSSDAFLSKFSASGNIIWATYYGGNGYDAANAVAIDANSTGSVYICGSSVSTDSISTTGAHQTIPQGQNDGFIAKFSLAGSLLYGSYFGGSLQDVIHSAACDAQGNLFIAGNTSSLNNIGTTGSFRQAYIGGPQDGFLAKFNASGVRQWSTYFGGTGNVEGINDLAVFGNVVYVAGYTLSTGLGSSLTHQPIKADTLDAVLGKFSTTGSHIWTTYVGGSHNDEAHSVSADDSGNVYIAGVTTSPDGISTSGSHQQVYGGGISDGFIAKFNDAGIRQWGSYYGGGNSDDRYFLVWTPVIYTSFPCWEICAANGKVWLAGTSYSFSGVSSPGSYQDTLATGTAPGSHVDAVAASFTPGGTRLWSTYLGGPSTEIATGLACDKIGNVYLTGTTESTGGLVAGNAHQTVYGGIPWDAFVVRIYDSLSILRVRNVRPYCINDTFSIGHYITGNGTMRQGNVFRAELSNASGSFSGPAIIGTLTAGSGGSIPCALPAGISGSGYKLRITSSKPKMISDTVSINISNTYPAPVITRNGGTLDAGSHASYQWYRSGVAIPGATSATYKPTVNGPYTVVVTHAGGCKGTSAVYNMASVSVATMLSGDIKVYPNPASNFLIIEGAEGMNFTIQALTGQQLAAMVITSRTQPVAVDNLPAGIYIGTLIRTNGERQIFRVVRQ